MTQKTVPVHVRLDSGLLRRLDGAAHHRGMNRSRAVVAAVRLWLGEPIAPEASASSPALFICATCARPVVPDVGCACPDPDVPARTALEADSLALLGDPWASMPDARRPEDQDVELW